jgi:hypothetical protein
MKLLSNGRSVARFVTGRQAPSSVTAVSQIQDRQQLQVRWYMGKDPTDVDPEKSVYVQSNEEPIVRVCVNCMSVYVCNRRTMATKCSLV